MARVSVDSGELPSAKGKEGYDLSQVLRHWAMIADGQFEYDCRALLQMIDEVDELRLWEYAEDGFYKTRDEFLQKRVLIDFDLTEQSLTQIVSRLRGGEPVGLPRLGKHGEFGKGRPKLNRGDDITSKRGSLKKYLLARLERDAPLVLKRYEAGEFRSAAAAARAAGIKVGQSPLQKLRSAWKSASTEEQDLFRKEIIN
jgi:hypothetical protein